MENIGGEYNDLRSPEYQAVIIVDHNDGRLFPLTENVPTCLLPIANRKLLAYQLDMLSKSNVVETFIVAPEEYESMLKQFLAESPSRNAMNIEIIGVAEMNGSTHGLFAVADRIRGDFFCINCDVISQVGLIDLAHLHRQSISDVTIMFTVPSNKDALKDDVDQELVGITSEGRVIMKTPTLELEEGISVSKALLLKAQKPVSLRNDLLDVGVYLFSFWIIEFIKTAYRRLMSIKNDLIPYFINRQFQEKHYLDEKIPALQFRKRPLSFLEGWLTAKEQKFVGSELNASLLGRVNSHAENLQTISDFQELEASVSTPVRDNRNQEISQGDYRDYLRCYGIIYNFNTGETTEKNATTTTNPSMIISRVNTIPNYLSLNKEMPSAPYNSRTTWPRFKKENFSKKEMSLVGENTDFGEMVAYRQCFIGNNCKIGTRTKLNNCVIMDGVSIGDNCIIQNCVICERVVIENNCNLNECNVGMGYRLAAGNEIRGESLGLNAN